MNLPNWFNLSKTATDPQTIGEAIDEAISIHNEDAEAHMPEGASIENHRENPVIDHPAESVVNDKLQIKARRYVAIVDPSDDESFDTLESAVAYAITAGGGTVLVTEGSHYLSGNLVLPSNVNLAGLDRDTCILMLGSTHGGQLELEELAGNNTSILYFNDLTIEVDGSTGIIQETGSSYLTYGVEFQNCAFIGDTEFLYASMRSVSFIGCYFEVETQTCFEIEGRIMIDRCQLRQNAGTGSGKFIVTGVQGGYDSSIMCNNLWSISYDTDGIEYFTGSYLEGYWITNSKFSQAKDWRMSEIQAMISQCVIGIQSGDYFGVEVEGAIVTGCSFTGGNGNRVRLNGSSVKCIVTNNDVGTAITNTGTSNVVANNVVT